MNHAGQLKNINHAFDFLCCEQIVEIEDFVKEVLATKSPISSRNTRQIVEIQATSQAHRLCRYVTPEMYERFDYRSPYTQLFLTACRELSITDFFIPWVSRNAISRSMGAMRIAERIRSLAKSNQFRSKLFAHRNWGKVAYLKCQAYVDNLFRRHSRYTVIRIDLAFKAAYLREISLSNAKHYLDEFFHGSYATRPAVFDKLAGYVWKAEFGTQAGFHFHVLLFFRNVHGARARYWADELGVFWIATVSNGRGRYDNCNAREYHDNGLGEVNRSDTQKLKILYHQVLKYFFKEEQRIPVRRGDKKFRSFGTGEFGNI